MRYTVSDRNSSALFEKMVYEQLWDVDFAFMDPIMQVQDVYKDDFGSTNLTNLGFTPIYNDTVMLPLLLKEPTLSAFTPFNLHTYQRADDARFYTGHLMPTVMLDIAGVVDAGVRQEFSRQFAALDGLVDRVMTGSVEYQEFQKLPSEPLLQFTFTIPKQQKLADYLEDFQARFESVLDKLGYVVTGFRNIKTVAAERGIAFDRYAAFRIYSLCHIGFSEAVFNHGRPDAGVFAPCSLYLYVEEGSDKLVVGIPVLDNWIKVMNIGDPKMTEASQYHDREMVEIMQSLGGIRF